MNNKLYICTYLCVKTNMKYIKVKTAKNSNVQFVVQKFI